MTDTGLLFDPLDPAYIADPYPAYQRVRTVDPIHEHPYGFWFVSGYDDVSAILRAAMSVNDRLLEDGLVRQQFDDLDEGDGRVLALTMLDRDPPDHTRLRSLVSKAFTPRKIAELEPEIVTLVDQALDRMAEAGRTDLVETLAFPLPFEVISAMLGMPSTDRDRVRDLSGTLVLSLEAATDAETAKLITAASTELVGLVRQLIERKRAEPGDDLLTALIAAESDGDRLTDDELIAQVVLLYVAGHETTVNLIANGVTALLRHPDQLALLRERPELTANAVEEMLRYDSPVQMSRRITVEPYQVGDRVIPKGAFVLAALGSANHDERYWGADAGEFRIDRENARHHVSFGAGHHHCLGAALARLEGKIAIERLVSRFPRLALAGEPTGNGRSNLRGLASVPISVG
ncbi:cytochrome P450 [Nonomuraea longicatena]|uniref:Cytochrome P450 n=1 Tax=Nonomuraea longicatena TaxID=83682 RepID=A0ABN1P684_9ACTN